MSLAAVGLALAPALSSTVSGLFASKAASANRSFQEKLSNTAHQREVIDLRAAGLNPILSAYGRGASTPSGAVAQIPDVGKSVSSGVSNAIQASSMRANVRNINAIAGQNELDARISQDALGFYDRADPSVKAGIQSTKINQAAGGPTWMGPFTGLAGGASNAIQRMKQATQDKVTETLEPRLKRHYKRLNKRQYPSIDYKSSPQYRGSYKRLD